MSRFRKRKGRAEGPDEAAEAMQELLDPYHGRASIVGDSRMLLEPGKVLENIAAAMDRVDLDIDTEMSIEDDVASLDEIMGFVQSLRFGPTLAVHVVNNAMRIMLPRYPIELVRRPLPPQYDVRNQLPGMSIDDTAHETAKRIFNRRLSSDVDLAEQDIADDLHRLDATGQAQVFNTLFFLYGLKVATIKHQTGAS